jgi:hypothetical protein
MKRGLMAGAALGAALLSGCATVNALGPSGVAEKIEENAANLNDAHTRAETAIIAMNVLRARDRWPTNYTTLSGIKSNPTLSLNGSASFGPLGLGNARLPFSGSSASVSRNETANAEYSVNPFANSDKTQSLLKPMLPQMMQNYWRAGWPKETLMWLFIDSLTFAGEKDGWRVDGDEKNMADGSPERAHLDRYIRLIQRAKAGEFDFAQLPSLGLEQRNCTPYDPVYLRETLGADGGDASMGDAIKTVEALTGKKLVLTEDTRNVKGEAYIAPDKFGRRLLLCDTTDNSWGFVDTATGKPVALIRTRSFDDMIYFLGQTLRAGTPGHPAEFGGTILFQVFTERGDKQYAVRVEHAGQVYFIAPQAPLGHHDGPRDVTGNVLSLLNQLYLLAQSDDFLRAPEARLK